MAKDRSADLRFNVESEEAPDRIRQALWFLYAVCDVSDGRANSKIRWH